MDEFNTLLDKVEGRISKPKINLRILYRMQQRKKKRDLNKWR